MYPAGRVTSSPRFAFRNVPPVIYVAFALSTVGTIALALAMLLSSSNGRARFESLQRWWTLDLGCDAAAAILLALGLFELARRQTGPRRRLVQAGACLGLATLGWLAARPLIALAEPRGDKLSTIYEWLGYGTSLFALAGVVLLAFGADAWRRVPAAAIALVLLGVTAYGIPLLGRAIMKHLGDHEAQRQLYGLGRLGVSIVATAFVAATLAADGRDPAPDPRAAAAGLRLARGVLVFRLVAAILIAMVMVVGRSPSAAKFVAFAGPAVVVVTMVLFAVGLQRAAAARLDGMPRLLLAIAAALTLWWGAIQLDQLSSVLEILKHSYRSERAMQTLQHFSIIGPIAATIGLALVGTAISTFAARRGDSELRAYAYGRTVTFLVLTLSGVGLQAYLTKATSLSSLLMMVLLAATATIAGLLVLASLLLRAADAVEAEPGLPPARLV